MNGCPYWGSTGNLLKKMRLLVTFFLSGLLTVSATTYSQQTKFRLKFNDATVKEVFKQIEDNSEFILFYNEDYVDVNRRVSIDAHGRNVEYILDEVFKGTQNSYRINRRQIVILAPGITNVPFGADSGVIQQQKISVSGKVTDTSGAPLPGVAIMIKGTTVGSITDVNGNYTLANVPGNATLSFSFIGMKTQEIPVSGKTEVHVKMQGESIDIEEVVAVGYGSMKRSDLTGATSSVSAADFKLHPIMTPTDALIGRLSGVQITNTSGNVDASVKVRIRGTNSINGGNDPLYVCDGVVGTGMPSVEEIESIEVLKDASATAIYGSRGANGVILITTKKGKEGVTRVTVNGFGSFLQPVNLYETLDAYEYAQEVNILYNNVYTENQLNAFRSNGGTDWQKEVLNNAWKQKYNVAIDGGSQKVRYHIFSEYYRNTALIKRQAKEGYNVRSRLNIDLFRNVDLEWHVNGGYGHSTNTGSSLYEGGADAILFNALTWGPTESIYESDGAYNLADPYGAMGNNPVQRMKEKNVWAKSFSITSNSALTWKVFPELSLQYRLNVSLSNGNSYDWESTKYTLSHAEASGSKSFSNHTFQNFIVNWDKRYGNHHVSATAVGESSKYTSDSLSGSGEYFGNENLGYWGMSNGSTRNAGVGWSDWSLLSGVGRVNYNYAGKYYLTGAFRADASSKFAQGNRWSYYPSGSVAWRASEEAFVKGLNVFSNLKLRASYGKTGNQGVGPYSTVALLSSEYAYYTYTGRVYGYTSKTINKDLQWEETGQLDFGVDAGFFNDRLTVTMDYYQKDTKKLLLLVTTPYFLGGDDIYVNKGEVMNNGFEVSVNATPIEKKEFSWDFNVNFSTNKNEIVDLGGETIYGLSSSGNNDAILSNETYILQEGIALGSLYGYKWLGIWQENEAAEAAKYGNKPGDNKYADLTPDGTINASDRTNIGNGTPKYIWGFNSTLRYKGWDMNILLEGIHGCDKLNIVYAMASSQHSKSRTITLKEAWDNSWTSSNASNRFPNVTSETSTNYLNSTQWIQDASFVRLRNISLGYTFKKRLTRIADCRVFVSAQNLFTITDYNGYDPEATSTLTSDVSTGIDSGITPSARTFTVGAQLSF